MRSSVEVGATSWMRFSSGREPAAVSAMMKLVAPAARASALEALPAVGLEQRGVGHRDQRRVADEGAGGGEALEAGGGAHAGGERLLGGGADHRPVGERVGEGEADLDDVGAAGDCGLGEGRRLGARPSGR